jgi:hypothetical protein
MSVSVVRFAPLREPVFCSVICGIGATTDKFHKSCDGRAALSSQQLLAYTFAFDFPIIFRNCN